jgi:hypothetical protein
MFRAIPSDEQPIGPDDEIPFPNPGKVRFADNTFGI